ncbi:aldose 1-epimerase family protein [Enterococcus sp. CSURQ0835]|uniref:aldose 1-epimerase family protein n=1 Tax=Enterococcus sp. CSURQ0835 TaxID=2681394 RepID=UPI001359EA01|nr:aldose 1-epimerase family protein [Enterococcus sp. CSURQ0835]
MSITIQNDHVVATIAEKGAELTSFQQKKSGLEYIWQADPEYWGRHAPILFPFIGRLKDDQYTYQGQTYPMGQHGFARDKTFQVLDQTEEMVTLALVSDEQTRQVYPFDFVLTVSYEVWADGLRVRFQVENTSSDEMIFALGGHPAFNVPLEAGQNFEDYYLAFSPQKTRVMIPLEGPFVNLDQKTLGQTNTNVQLSHDLFANDAVIFETLGLNRFTIGNEDSFHSVTLTYNHIPYVGFWSPYPKEAPFVCIEPWWGFADPVDSSGKLEEKPGMNRLAAGDVFNTQFSITIS